MRISDWSSDVCSSDLVRPHENSLATLCPRCTHSSGPSLTKAAGRRAPIGFLADDPRSEPWSPRTTKVLPIEAFIRSHNHLSAARFLSRNGAAEQTRTGARFMSASFVIASQEVPKDAAVVSLAGHRLKLGKFVRRVGEYLEFEHTRPMQSVVECAHRGDDFSICRVTRQPKEEAARAVRDITHILFAVAWKPSLADEIGR